VCVRFSAACVVYLVTCMILRCSFEGLFSSHLPSQSLPPSLGLEATSVRSIPRPFMYTLAQLDLILQGGGDSVVHRVQLEESVLDVVLQKPAACCSTGQRPAPAYSLLLSSLEVSDTQVYEPSMRANTSQYNALRLSH